MQDLVTVVVLLVVIEIEIGVASVVVATMLCTATPGDPCLMIPPFRYQAFSGI